MAETEAIRLLIVVVAYEDEDTLHRVLDRIPLDFVERNETEVLVLDSGSSDGTFRAALSWAEDWMGRIPTIILQSPGPQDYGASLKLAFEYAIEHGFDAVALLKGDGKYAPELLPQIVEPIASGDADAVIGSRFLEGRLRSLRGMPLHKWVGNQVLTVLQNRLLGCSLSDIYSGYRAYSTATLREIPFQYNADGFHFDTDILIQLFRGGFRVAEAPIPSYHGEYVKTRRAFAYAKGSLFAAIASFLDSLGVRYQRKYDIKGGPAEYSVKLGYRSSHSMAIETVTAGTRVLDIGCGHGYVAKNLLAKDCHVVGLDQYPPDAKSVSEFVRWELGSDRFPSRLSDFDFVLLLDIVEHLPSPERFLETLRRSSALERPTIVLTAPNVAFLPMRIMLLIGQFNYGKEGILDFTHTRLFTFASLKTMLQQVGYEILEIRGIPAPFPKALGDGKFAHLLVALNDAFIRLSKTLFSYQIFMKVRPLPTVDALLADTIRHSAEKRTEYEEADVTSGPTGE